MEPLGIHIKEQVLLFIVSNNYLWRIGTGWWEKWNGPNGYTRKWESQSLLDGTCLLRWRGDWERTQHHMFAALALSVWTLSISGQRPCELDLCFSFLPLVFCLLSHAFLSLSTIIYWWFLHLKKAKFQKIKINGAQASGPD